MSGVNLIMPMAGRGSRFAAQGIAEPKPLINLHGKPFFWWAAESARRAVSIDHMIFVVLDEHISDWSIDRRIHDFYPTAEIIAIPDVTSGSAETAAIGVRSLTTSGPIIINDCDHAFIATHAHAAISHLNETSAGALMTFRSNSPNYSYIRLSPSGAIIGTVEKEVASNFAIAGCYLFNSAATFTQQYERYIRDCPYSELFISGMYNQMLASGLHVEQIILDQHFAFGTPDEYANIFPSIKSQLAGWRQP